MASVFLDAIPFASLRRTRARVPPGGAGFTELGFEAIGLFATATDLTWADVWVAEAMIKTAVAIIRFFMVVPGFLEIFAPFRAPKFSVCRAGGLPD